jgi:excisionase family DNA binding protein
LLTPDEAAGLLGVPRKTILRWAASGYMPGHKLGRRWRFMAARGRAMAG